MNETLRLPKVDHEGKVYRSFTAMCREYGVPVEKAKKKLYAGFDMNLILDNKTEVVIPQSKIMDLPKAKLYVKPKKRIKDEVTKEVFLNLSRCARANNISVYSLYHQVNVNNLAIHEAVEKCKKLKKSLVKNTRMPIKVYDDATGITYSSIRACAIENGVDPDLFRVRVKKGMAVRDAIESTKHAMHRQSFSPNYSRTGSILVDEKTGNKYVSFADCARQNQIDSRKLRENIRVFNMSVHDAIVTCQS